MQESTSKVVVNIAIALAGFALGSFLNHMSYSLEKLEDKKTDEDEFESHKIDTSRRLSSIESDIRSLKNYKACTTYTTSID